MVCYLVSWAGGPRFTGGKRLAKEKKGGVCTVSGWLYEDEDNRVAYILSTGLRHRLFLDPCVDAMMPFASAVALRGSCTGRTGSLFRTFLFLHMTYVIHALELIPISSRWAAMCGLTQYRWYEDYNGLWNHYLYPNNPNMNTHLETRNVFCNVFCNVYCSSTHTRVHLPLHTCAVDYSVRKGIPLIKRKQHLNRVLKRKKRVSHR